MVAKPRLRPAGYPMLALAGALLGTVWNQLHVQAGALAYTAPFVAGQPWWMPLEFAAVFVAAGALFTFLGDLAPRSISPKIAGAETVWLTAVVAMTAFLDRWPWLLAGLLILTLAARGGDLVDVFVTAPIPAITVLIVWSVASAMLATAGAVEYRTSQIGPLPLWVLLLWANSVVFIARLVEAHLQRFGVRRIVEPATAVVPPVDPPADEERTSEDD